MTSGLHYLIVVLALVIASCSTPGLPERDGARALPDTFVDPEQLLGRLQQMNSGLSNFKGLGSLSLSRSGVLHLKDRVAWVGSPPLCLRVAVMSAGRPFLKLAANGSWLYVQDPRSKQTMHRRLLARDANLKWIATVPIRTSEFLAFLSGRVPDIDGRAIWLSESTTERRILALKQWWWTAMKVYVRQEGSVPYMVEAYDWMGGMRYRVALEAYKVVDEYYIPTQISISNGRDAKLLLTIDRYHPNVDVSPSMFVLTFDD